MMELTKDMLNEFGLAEKELKRIEDKLEYYETHPLASEHGVVKGSMSGFPYAEKSFKVSAPDVKSDYERHKKVSNLLIQLRSRQKQYEQMLIDMDYAIESVKDTEMRLILQYKYIEKRSDKWIAEQLCYEPCTIRKKIDRFLAMSHNSQSQ